MNHRIFHIEELCNKTPLLFHWRISDAFSSFIIEMYFFDFFTSRLYDHRAISSLRVMLLIVY